MDIQMTKRNTNGHTDDKERNTNGHTDDKEKHQWTYR